MGADEACLRLRCRQQLEGRLCCSGLGLGGAQSQVVLAHPQLGWQRQSHTTTLPGLAGRHVLAFSYSCLATVTRGPSRQYNRRNARWLHMATYILLAHAAEAGLQSRIQLRCAPASGPCMPPSSCAACPTWLPHMTDSSDTPDSRASVTRSFSWCRSQTCADCSRQMLVPEQY